MVCWTLSSDEFALIEKRRQPENRRRALSSMMWINVKSAYNGATNQTILARMQIVMRSIDGLVLRSFWSRPTVWCRDGLRRLFAPVY